MWAAVNSAACSCQTIRKKDGKEHRYFSVVENKRVASGRVVQRHVLYLGEINDRQELAWTAPAERKSPAGRGGLSGWRSPIA
jgi:hypothetical protein